MMARTLGAYAVVAALVALLMALAACGGDGEAEVEATATVDETAVYKGVVEEQAEPRGDADGGDLAGVTWVLESLGPAASPDAIVEGSEATAVFSADGSMDGNGGCNTYFGSYRADGGSISIGELGWTEMACAAPDGVMAQETRFFELMAVAETFAVEDGALTLGTADGGVLVFSAAGKAPGPGPDGGAVTDPEATVSVANEDEGEGDGSSASGGVSDPGAGDEDAGGALTGVTWVLESLGPAASPDAVAEGSEVTAVFSADGSLNGNGGCNTYFGGYEAEGESLSVGAMGSTLMACADPEGVMAQETRFFGLMAVADSFAVGDGKLTLRTADGGVLVFSRRSGP